MHAHTNLYFSLTTFTSEANLSLPRLLEITYMSTTIDGVSKMMESAKEYLDGKTDPKDASQALASSR